MLACVFGVSYLYGQNSPAIVTTAEVTGALQQCGISPHRISWAISSKGALVLGKANTRMPPLPVESSAYLIKWVDDRGVAVEFTS